MCAGARHLLGHVEHSAQPGWLCSPTRGRWLCQVHGLAVGHVGARHHRPYRGHIRAPGLQVSVRADAGSLALLRHVCTAGCECVGSWGIAWPVKWWSLPVQLGFYRVWKKTSRSRACARYLHATQTQTYKCTHAQMCTHLHTRDLTSTSPAHRDKPQDLGYPAVEEVKVRVL